MQETQLKSLRRIHKRNSQGGEDGGMGSAKKGMLSVAETVGSRYREMA